MTRSLTAGIQAEIAKRDGETIWLVQFLEAPSGQQGSLARIASGKRLDLDTTTLSDTSDFTVIQGGTLDLLGVGGRLRAVPSATLSDQLIATYDSGPSDYRGLVLQIEFVRNVGSDTISGFPSVAVPVPGALDYYMLQKYVNDLGTTYPGGPYNEDSQLRYFSGLAEINVGDKTIFSQHVQHPVILSYGADGGPIKGYVFPGSAGRIDRDGSLDPNGAGTPIDSDDPLGMHIRWEDGAGNDYDDAVEIPHIRAYSSEYICVFNLPPNYKATIKTGASSSHGGPIGGSVSGLGGTSVIWLNGEACPYQSIEVVDVSDPIPTLVSLSPSDGVWGGDCYRWTPPAPTEVLAVSNADTVHLWNSISFSGLGRQNLTIAPLRESSDLRAQRVELELSAVDTTVLDTLKSSWYRGGLVRIWMAKVVDGAVVADPIGPFEFVATDGLQGEERWSQRGRPGRATVKLGLSSKLEILGTNPGFRTNLKSHQRWFPSDTGMQLVPQYAGRRIFWGTSGPSSSSILAAARRWAFGD